MKMETKFVFDFGSSHLYYWYFQDGASGKESPSPYRRCKRRGFDPCVRNIPKRREWLPTPVFLSGESHGQRNLAVYSPWVCRVRHDWVTEHTHTHIHYPFMNENMKTFSSLWQKQDLWNLNKPVACKHGLIRPFFTKRDDLNKHEGREECKTKYRNLTNNLTCLNTSQLGQ